jgi:1,4-dihydroxy-2-naphthoyl-CoA hydrolase
LLNISVGIEFLNKGSTGNMVAHLGIEYTEIGEKYISGKMPVDERTKQPFGLLHGGASVVLAETLGSVGSNLCVDTSKYACVGLEINANHIKSAKSGYVYGRAELIHEGKSTHIWDVKITNAEGELVCVSRLTVAVIEKRQ